MPEPAPLTGRPREADAGLRDRARAVIPGGVRAVGHADWAMFAKNGTDATTPGNGELGP